MIHVNDTASYINVVFKLKFQFELTVYIIHLQKKDLRTKKEALILILFK
jgi:hypothetical protein